MRGFNPLYSQSSGHTLKKVASNSTFFFRQTSENRSLCTSYTQRLIHHHIPKHYQYCRQQNSTFLQKASNTAQQQQLRTISTKIPKGRKIFLRPTKIKRKVGRKTRPTIKPEESSPDVSKLTAWEQWLAPRTMPPRKTSDWYLEMALVCTVFAITGSSTMVLVRPAVSNILGLKGSMKEGPWSYRICSLVIMTPLYAAMLVCVGTAFGRHAYFKHFAVKMFSRFGIPPALMDKNFHQTAKNFRKY